MHLTALSENRIDLTRRARVSILSNSCHLNQSHARLKTVVSFSAAFSRAALNSFNISSLWLIMLASALGLLFRHSIEKCSRFAYDKVLRW